MQQPCRKCGYESPETDKFCRQCGDHLVAENEFSGATTLNHGRTPQNPPVAAPGTGRLNPSIGDVIAGQTERYYNPPQYAPASVTIAPSQNFEPVKPRSFSWLMSFSGFFKGVLVFVMFLALLAATAGVVFFSQEARRERDRRFDTENRSRTRFNGDNANARARDAWTQVEDALRLIDEAAEKAAGAGATLTAGSDKPVDLGKYAYPGADVESKVGSYGNETLSLSTSQNFESVQDYYEKQFGKPVIQMAGNSPRNNRGNARRRLLFQSATLPTVLVRIEEVNNNEVKITILQTLLRFPRNDGAAGQK